DNQSDDESIGEKALDELKKWGRFQIIPDRAQADLIFVFAAGEYTSYVTKNAPYTTEVKEGYTYLTVVDAKSGEHLWNASQKWGNVYSGHRSATRGLIKGLKQELEEQAGKLNCCNKRS